jgi:hypothetical protein
MKAEEEQRRADSEETARRQDADPEYVRQRDAARQWWSDQFARINAAARAEEAEMRKRCRDPWIHTWDCTCRTDQEER